MANVKITELTAETNPVSTDVLPIVDVSADATKKITIADLLENAGNGSAGSPAFAFDSDPDTGMYREGTNKLGLATAGTGRLFIEFNGSVGLGTNTPTELLHLTKDSAHKILLERTGAVPSEVIFGNSGQTALISNNTNGVAFQTGATPSEKLRINASGNVGVGTSSPGQKLDVVGSVKASAGYFFGSTSSYLYEGAADEVNLRVGADGPYAEFRDAGSNVLEFGNVGGELALTAGGTERMRIDTEGALSIFNGTAPTASATNGVKLYAEDVSSSSELKVRDEAGNVTTLSPHNFDLIPEGPSEDMAWSYYSERDGKRINVDMLKAVRLLEQLSGEQLVFIS